MFQNLAPMKIVYSIKPSVMLSEKARIPLTCMKANIAVAYMLLLKSISTSCTLRILVSLRNASLAGEKYVCVFAELTQSI
jgi:hypothetical protein